MCHSIADRFVDTRFKMTQRMCKNLNNFTQESPAIMAGNLGACPPAEMVIAVVVNPDDGGGEVTLATFKVVQEEYTGGSDSYGSSFFHFAVKSIKFTPVAKLKGEENIPVEEAPVAAPESMEIDTEEEEASTASKVAQAPLEDIAVNASIVTQIINNTTKQLKRMQRVQYKNSRALNTLENKKPRL